MVDFAAGFVWPKWVHKGARVIVPFLVPGKGTWCTVTIAAGDMMVVENESHHFCDWRRLDEVAVPQDSPMAGTPNP